MRVGELIDRFAVGDLVADRAAADLFAGGGDRRLGDGDPVAGDVVVRELIDRFAVDDLVADRAAPHPLAGGGGRRLGDGDPVAGDVFVRQLVDRFAVHDLAADRAAAHLFAGGGGGGLGDGDPVARDVVVRELIERFAVDDSAAERAAADLFAGGGGGGLGDRFPLAGRVAVRRVPDGRFAEQDLGAAGIDPHARCGVFVDRIACLLGIVAEDALPVEQHLHAGGRHGQLDGEVLSQGIELPGRRGGGDGVGRAGAEQIAAVALQHQTVRIAVFIGAKRDLRTGPDTGCLRGDAQREHEVIGVGAVDTDEAGVVDIEIPAAVGVHRDRVRPNGEIVAAVVGADAGGEIRDPVRDLGHILFFDRVVGGIVRDQHAGLAAVDLECRRAGFVVFVIRAGIGQDTFAVHEDVRALRRDDGGHGECFIHGVELAGVRRGREVLIAAEQIRAVALEHRAVCRAVRTGAEHQLRAGPDAAGLRGDLEGRLEDVGVGARQAGEAAEGNVVVLSGAWFYAHGVFPMGDGAGIRSGRFGGQLRPAGGLIRDRRCGGRDHPAEGEQGKHDGKGEQQA